MKTPIHVLCYNFTEIVHREVDETMRRFPEKKFAKCVFSAPFRAGLTDSAKSLQGSVPRDSMSPYESSPNRFRFAGVIPEKK